MKSMKVLSLVNLFRSDAQVPTALLEIAISVLFSKICDCSQKTFTKLYKQIILNFFFSLEIKRA